MIEDASSNEACTRMGEAAFGKTQRHKMVEPPKPNARSAMTYSRVRIDSACARATCSERRVGERCERAVQVAVKPADRVRPHCVVIEVDVTDDRTVAAAGDGGGTGRAGAQKAKKPYTTECGHAEPKSHGVAQSRSHVDFYLR